MKRYTFWACLLIFLMGGILASCKTKSGCPANESLRAKTNRKGEFRAGHAKTNLFPKEMRKKMGH